MPPLSTRRALVCGASAGLGRAIALALAARGVEIIALARRADVLEELLPELIAAGAPNATALPADFDDREDLARKVAGLDVQILVHNLGGPPGGKLMEESPDKLATWFGRHVLSAQVLLRAVLPAMSEAGWGRIFTVTSTSVREPIPNLGVSNTVRGAMAAWVKTLSHELPPGITINNLMPGFHDTDRLVGLADAGAERTGTTPEAIREGWIGMVPERRIGDPADFGELVAFLCSDAGGYIRGAAIPVDGGRMRCI